MTDRETRRLSFGSVAEDYDRYRPGPPPQALDWLIPPGADAVLDLAAGTGLVTRELTGGPGGWWRWDETDVPLICRYVRSTRLPG